MSRAMITTLLSCLLSAIVVVGASRVSAAGEDEHEKWVATSLHEMQTVKVGMKRSDLERVFETEGGLATPLHTRYVFKRCQYFKVDVEFSHSAEGGGSENDRIEKISAPYLAWPVQD